MTLTKSSQARLVIYALSICAICASSVLAQEHSYPPTAPPKRTEAEKAEMAAAGRPTRTIKALPPSGITPADTTTADCSALTKYQFSATVDLKQGTPPFPVAKGDMVTGTFTFDPSVKDTYISPTQGKYVQQSPTSVQVILGEITINADLNNRLGYYITITDNDSSVKPTRDIFSWFVNDTVLAASYGLDYIQSGFSLTDYTAAVFNGDAMPDNLTLSNFSRGNLFLSGSKGGAGLWNLRSQIISVDLVQ